MTQPARIEDVTATRFTSYTDAELAAGYALRSLGLFFCVAAVLFALGGLVQINPIWQWGRMSHTLGPTAPSPTGISAG